MSLSDRSGISFKNQLLFVFGVFFLKFLNPSLCINQLLLTGEKGMALRTYVYVNRILR